MKNIRHSEVLILKEQVDYGFGQVVSKTLVQNNRHSLTLFSFDKDEEISTHSSQGDALILVLEGTAKVTIDNNEHILSEGETIVMPANHPHSVYALCRFKMLLDVSFPKK